MTLLEFIPAFNSVLIINTTGSFCLFYAEVSPDSFDWLLQSVVYATSSVMR